MNALKHGMTARTPVLPGEDPEAFRQRVDDFMEALAPRDGVERFLVERMATASWKIERADRVEAARLAAIVRAAPTGPDPRRQEEVAALGRWLIAEGEREKMDATRLLLPFIAAERQSAFHGGGGDPLHVVFRLEATAEGCRWLCVRWAELREALERGEGWRLDELVRAISLLGQRPLNLDPYNWQTLAKGTYAAGPEAIQERERQLLRQLDDGIPNDRAGRRAALLRLVERTTARLDELVAVHDGRDAADAAARADRLAFDAQPEGEAVRRHQFGCDRALHRALNALLRLRRAGACGAGPQPQAPGPDGPPSVPATTSREDGPGVEPAHPSSSAPDGAAAPREPERSLIPSQPESSSAASGAPWCGDIEQEETATPADDHRNMQNEPRSPADDDRIPQNEPSPAARVATSAAPVFAALFVLALSGLPPSGAGAATGPAALPWGPYGEGGGPPSKVYSGARRPVEYLHQRPSPKYGGRRINAPPPLPG